MVTVERKLGVKRDDVAIVAHLATCAETDEKARLGCEIVFRYMLQVAEGRRTAGVG